VYVGADQGKVYALNGASGAQLWEFGSGGFQSSPALGAGGTVYVGGKDGKVYALVGATGAKRWEYASRGEVLSSPAVGANGTVYVGSRDGSPYALSGATGAKLWEYQTFVSSERLEGSILAGDLMSSDLIRVVGVQVRNPGSAPSPPLAFTIAGGAVQAVESQIVGPNDSGVVSTAPTSPTESGVTARLSNTGGAPVIITAASYSANPVGETAFSIGEGAFVDLRIVGADSQDVAEAAFYYPSTVSGSAENKLKLRYFDGTKWVPVLSSGGKSPDKDTTDDLDQTDSGGRFMVTFDATSRPSITELGGTVFGMFDSTPQILDIVGPSAPVALGEGATLLVYFATVGEPTEVRIAFDWQDGSLVDEVGPTSVGSTMATHSYLGAGVYPVTVRVTDESGDTVETRFEYVVVYDPNGDFVTGGGWINSPAGAFHPDLEGFAGAPAKATFSFVQKYLKHHKVPSGNAGFQAGNLNLKSQDCQWLVVAGAQAQFRGWGTINGQGRYAFLVKAIDGALLGKARVDRFRIQIWEESSGSVVYDNQPGAEDMADLATDGTLLGGGSIVIHKR